MMRIATKAATKSSFKYKIGAALVNHGSIIGVGYNAINRYTNKWKQLWPGSLHAEESAILNALKKSGLSGVIGSTLYVSRVCRSGELALARPCNHCQALIKAFQVKDVYYTSETGIQKLEY